jgi:hypothetical protein
MKSAIRTTVLLALLSPAAWAAVIETSPKE